MIQSKFIIVEGTCPSDLGEKINDVMERGYRKSGKTAFASFRDYNGSGNGTKVIFYQSMELVEPDETFCFMDTADTVITKEFARSVSKMQAPYKDGHKKNTWRFKVWCGNSFHIFDYNSEADARFGYTGFREFRKNSMAPMNSDAGKKAEILAKYRQDKEEYK